MDSTRSARALVLSVLALSWMELPSLPQSAPASGRPVRIPVVRDVPADHPTIQQAILAARDRDVVRVRRGTYHEHLDFLGKAIEVVGHEGPASTIVAPISPGAVVRFHSGEGPASRLIGFTLRDGTGSPDDSAAGVSAVDPHTGIASRPTLSDCVIENNVVGWFSGGSGPGGVSGEALLERCVLRANRAQVGSQAGGAAGRLTLIGCVIEENEGCLAGGLLLEPGSYVLDCVLRANRAGGCYSRFEPLAAGGGAIRTSGPGVVVEGSLLFDNVVTESPEPGGLGGCYFTSHGGALSGEALLARCTLVGNRWEACGTIGGIEGSPSLRDCILYANDDPPGYYTAQMDVRYSDVEGGAAGAGSFDLFPVLVDPG